MPMAVVDNKSVAASARILNLDPSLVGSDGTFPICELPTLKVASGVYKSLRKQLSVPCAPTAKLSGQPAEVQALVCSCCPGAGQGAPEYAVLLSPEHGAQFLLPREGAPKGSEVRARPVLSADKPSGFHQNVVVVARGPDPYDAALDAAKCLAHATGAPVEEVRTYMLPLLDCVHRMRYDGAIAASVAAGKAKAAGGSSHAAAAAAALEQQLHEGFLVQAGPSCPAKPLLQAPGLRLCPGMSAPLGLRYSGMSVVYGKATGHVLAVMDTAAALKMAPVGGLRSAAIGSFARASSLGIESPAGVSGGVSAATSAAPSPCVSRSNSLGVMALEAVTALADMPAPLTPSPSLPVTSLSGRSVIAAPIIQVVAAAAAAAAPDQSAAPARPGGSSSPTFAEDPAAEEDKRTSPFSTPTGAAAHALASFALVGVKAAGGREGAVHCCRIMPACAVASAGEAASAAAPAPAAVSPGSSPGSASGAGGGLGLVLQVEVAAAGAATLLVFVEGADEEGEEGDAVWLRRRGEQQRPVRGVKVEGRQARWRYDSHGCMLAVEVPAPQLGAGAGAARPRTVQIYI